MPANEEERLLIVQDVADRFQVPPSWVYAKAESGELPHFKIGRYLRFRSGDIESFLQAQRRESTKRA